MRSGSQLRLGGPGRESFLVYSTIRCALISLLITLLMSPDLMAWMSDPLWPSPTQLSPCSIVACIAAVSPLFQTHELSERQDPLELRRWRKAWASVGELQRAVRPSREADLGILPACRGVPR